jgi:hypothetical protein
MRRSVRISCLIVYDNARSSNNFIYHFFPLKRSNETELTPISFHIISCSFIVLTKYTRTPQKYTALVLVKLRVHYRVMTSDDVIRLIYYSYLCRVPLNTEFMKLVQRISALKLDSFFHGFFHASTFECTFYIRMSV